MPIVVVERDEDLTNVRSIAENAIFDELSESNMDMLLGVNGEMKDSMDMLKEFLVTVWSKRKRRSERVLNKRKVCLNNYIYVRERSYSDECVKLRHETCKWTTCVRCMRNASFYAVTAVPL